MHIIIVYIVRLTFLFNFVLLMLTLNYCSMFFVVAQPYPHIPIKLHPLIKHPPWDTRGFLELHVSTNLPLPKQLQLHSVRKGQIICFNVYILLVSGPRFPLKDIRAQKFPHTDFFLNLPRRKVMIYFCQKG